MATPIDRDELAAKLEAGVVKLLDAQAAGKFERAHIPGAIRGTTDDAASVLAALGDDLGAEVVVYCTDLACLGSAYAVEQLAGVGFTNVRRYAEGLRDWDAAGLPVNRPGG